MLKTTTSSIEGFHIIQWLGIVTGVDLYMVGGLIGEGFLKQNDLFASASKRALERMESSASALGANAIIGISSSVAVV